MSAKQDLSALFAKAGLRSGAPTSHTIIDARKLKRELLCRAFAESFVKLGFDAEAAYRDICRERRARKRKGGWSWMRQRRVLAHIRDLVQSQTEDVKQLVRLDLAELIRINEAQIVGDITHYIEKDAEFVSCIVNGEERGELQTVYRLKVDPNVLTLEQRMAINRVVVRNGQIEGIELIDRLKAMQMQVALIELINAKEGSSDNTWVGAFKQKMTKVREERIAKEVALGKVVRLVPPLAKQA